MSRFKENILLDEKGGRPHLEEIIADDLFSFIHGMKYI